MTKIKRVGPPFLIVALIAGLIGYIIGCTREQRDRNAQARAQETQEPSQHASDKSKTGEQPASRQAEVSPVKARTRDVYFPNSEDLGPDEMRVISLGTGMPSSRRSQAASAWLVELGNGDKFLFDIGSGSAGNLGSLEIPYEYLNKVFISHLHTDHFGDLAHLYIGGVLSGRVGPLHVWGPSGAEERLGTAYACKHLKESLAWDIEGRKGRLPASAFELDVHEFDFKGENQVVYQKNGVTIRSWPAIHVIDGSVSYSLEWNGLKFVFGGDTYPNKWFNKYAQHADLAVHECMMAVENWIEKYRFPVGRALEVATQIHTTPEAFGKVMSTIKPRHAVAYHFFNDFDTVELVGLGVRSTYDGPLTLANDLYCWNVTKAEIRVRTVSPIEDAWPPPGAVKPPEVDTSGMKNVSPEIQAEAFDVLKENQGIYDRINKKYGTNIQPRAK